MSQTELLFEVHKRENNAESQAYLNENRERFSKQIRQLFNLLMSGEKINRLIAINKHNIMDMARRKKDLTDIGVQLHDDLKMNGLQTIYMTEEDKLFNKKYV